MFLILRIGKPVLVSLLRTSGDVSFKDARSVTEEMFAPHERRCFHLKSRATEGARVCSARAEMFLYSRHWLMGSLRLLRTSGDVSGAWKIVEDHRQFAPHERRCFVQTIT